MLQVDCIAVIVRHGRNSYTYIHLLKLNPNVIRRRQTLTQEWWDESLLWEMSNRT